MMWPPVVAEVDHMRGDAYKASNNRVSGGLVEGDVLVERDGIIQGRGRGWR